jgi:hypothetical protein
MQGALEISYAPSLNFRLKVMTLTPWICEGDLHPIGAHEITGEPLGGRQEQNRPTKGFYEG